VRRESERSIAAAATVETPRAAPVNDTLKAVVEPLPAAKKSSLPVPPGTLPTSGGTLPPLPSTAPLGGLSLQEALQAARQAQIAR
jgi:hypothetical protein